MNNLVPDGWSISKLHTISKVSIGLVTSMTPHYMERGVPLIRNSDIKENKVRQSKLIYLRPSFAEENKSRSINYRDIVTVHTGDIGTSAVVPKELNGCQGFATLNTRVDEAIIDPYYLCWFFNTETFTNYVLSVCTGDGRNNLNLKDFVKSEIVYPRLPEQQKIAAILTSVDEVIEKTQAQIDKLKDLKTAMMQELLTCGVGIDGKPHTEFKDSPVGRIPKNWTCSLLDEMAKRGSGHTPDKQKPEYWNEGIKWVSLTDSSKLDNLYIHDTMKKISQLGIENSSASLHPEGTVVMVRDAGIGKSAIITSPMAVSQHLMAWVCNGNLDNYFLYYLLQLWKPKFEVIAMGSTIKTIGLPYFKKLQIPVPPIEEQKIISSALKSVDSKIFILRRKHSSLGDTKKALMQDLLTGKVRVTVPAPSSPKAS
jgi:type I restriction enzyme S subunit